MTPAAPQSRKQAWRSESGRLLHRDRRWGERHPPGNTPRELGGRGPVGDAWEQALQLAGCGNLAAALECRADHRGLVFGDSEHAKSMSACGPAGQAAGIRGRRHRGWREGRSTMARSSIPKHRPGGFVATTMAPLRRLQAAPRRPCRYGKRWRTKRPQAGKIRFSALKRLVSQNCPCPADMHTNACANILLATLRAVDRMTTNRIGLMVGRVSPAPGNVQTNLGRVRQLS